MSTPTKIQATDRDTTITPRQLRSAGFIPATLYGSTSSTSRSIQVRSKEFTQLYMKGIRVFELEGLNTFARAYKLQVAPVGQDILSLEFLELDAAGMRKALAQEVANTRPSEPADGDSKSEAKKAMAMEAPASTEAQSTTAADEEEKATALSNV